MNLNISKLSTRYHEKVNARNAFIAEHNRKLLEMNQDIEAEKQTLDRINEILSPYVCKKCSGEGSESYIDAAGSKDYRKCKACNGTGVMPEGSAEE